MAKDLDKYYEIPKKSRVRWPVTWLLGYPVRFLFRVSYQGLENIPDEPFFLMANHRSMFDLMAIQLAMPRWVYWIAKRSLFEVPLIGWFVRRLGAIPLERNHKDLKAVRAVLKLAKEGESIGIFPQGTRVSERELAEVLPRGNSANLAYHAKLVILPVAIAKPWRLFGRQKIIFGVPFAPPAPLQRDQRKEEFERIMEEIMKKIFALAEIDWQPKK